MDLVSAYRCKLQQFSLACGLQDGHIVELVQSVAGGLEFSELEVPHADRAFSEVSN